MPISQTLVTRFFQLMTDKRFAEAERELQRLKRRGQETGWNRGYYKALYGMLLAKKTDSDQYTFISNLNLEDVNLIQSYRQEFLRHVRNRLHDEYDRGFFSAWADYMRILLKMHSQRAAKTKNPEETTRPKQAKISLYVEPKAKETGDSRRGCKTKPRKPPKRRSKRRSP